MGASNGTLIPLTLHNHGIGWRSLESPAANDVEDLIPLDYLCSGRRRRRWRWSPFSIWLSIVSEKDGTQPLQIPIPNLQLLLLVAKLQVPGARNYPLGQFFYFVRYLPWYYLRCQCRLIGSCRLEHFFNVFVNTLLVRLRRLPQTIRGTQLMLAKAHVGTG